MKRQLLILAGLFLAACGGPARDGNAFEFEQAGLTCRVEFRTERTVRILVRPEGSPLVTRRLVVDSLPGPEVGLRCERTPHGYAFLSSKLRVEFDRERGLFTFLDAATGERLLGEQERTLRRDTVAGEPCYAVTQRFATDPAEALYGLGQYQTGVVDYKRDTVLLLQANREIVNPYLVSTRGYGLLWDNYSASEFRDGGDVFEFVSEVGDAVDYWFVYGGDPEGCIRGYRELTGAASMLPKWAFGFWQSKERYKSAEELLGVAAEYRRRRIPIDVVVQDWEYWGEKPRWNALQWDSVRYPDPQAMVRSLHERYGVRLLVSVWPGFGPETAVYRDLEAAGALFNERTWAGYKVFDAYNPTAREIFWRHFRTGMFDTGADGWWMDATEPSFREGFTPRRQEARTKSAGRTWLGPFHRYLNTYSLVWMGDLYGRLREAAPERRPLLFTRSAFAGQQRYGTAVWSGDIVASWETMKRQLAAGVNLAASGFPYWTFDTGGFYVTTNGGAYPRGLSDPAYRELYARWFQFSAFLPLFRAHGTDIPREVWRFGDEHSVWYRNQLKYIELRYRLLPLIYATAYGVACRDESFMEALGVAFPDDRAVAGADDSYLFCGSLLVHPVFEPMAEGASAQRVETLLPRHAGEWWYDLFTGEAFRGGERVVRTCGLMELPVYVRGGSIVPMGEARQSTAEGPDERLEIRIYAGADARFVLYDDAGDGYGYTRGEYARCELEWSEADAALRISDREGDYPGMAREQVLHVQLMRPGAQPLERTLRYRGQAVTCPFPTAETNPMNP